MFSGILTMCFSLVQVVSAQEYSDTLSRYLKMGPASRLHLNVHGRKAADIDKRLSQIYTANGIQLFWIKQGRPDARGVEILEVLKEAGTQGLDPADYFTDRIEQYWNCTDRADIVRLDILLTMGMLRYVADQREGRIQPRQLDPELFANAHSTEVDWDVFIKAALRAPNMKVFMEQQAPPFYQYRALQKQLAQYQTIAAKGGWPSIPGGKILKPGMTDPRISILRKRLSIAGFLDTENPADMSSTEYDSALVEAVKRLQKRHNLAPDGVIGRQTLAVMNVPVEYRVRQIVINMERYRWLNRDIMGERLVAVNIAGFEAVAGRPGDFTVSTPVIVGKKYHMTPVFNDTIKYVVFNPYWNLTPSIARNEILPKLRKNPHYLASKNMRIFKGWGSDAREVNPESIDWNKVSKRDMNRYHVRQDPGPDNALGCLKLVFPNKYNVYLHDTPAHGLFKRQQRDFSHGCIRMDRPKGMAAWVLGGKAKGWDVERINEIIATRKRQVVLLDKPVPVYILYRTAYVNPADRDIYFYDDIYGRDRLLINALFGKPETTKT